MSVAAVVNTGGRCDVLSHRLSRWAPIAGGRDPRRIASELPRVSWTAICPTGGSHGAVPHEQDRKQRCDGWAWGQRGRAAPALADHRPWRHRPGSGPARGQRWSVARKREVVLRLLRGESSELLSRELGLPIYKLEQWRQKADAALDSALKEREADPAGGELAAAMQRIGELSMENELLRSRIERSGPLARRRSR